MSALLQIRGLAVRRGRETLLEGVDLDVAAGTIHVVAGPNGGGKTTLLLALLGIVEFTGDVRFHWRGPGRLAYVPQQLAVDRTLPLSVADFLSLGRQRRPACLGLGRRTRDDVAALLERVGLASLQRRALGALSGGELRRVLLARAIDPVPELLVLDEPAAGMDETSSRRFEEILVALRASGATVLMVSHDLDQVARLADRVTVLDRRVRRDGDAATALDALRPAAAAVAPREA